MNQQYSRDLETLKYWCREEEEEDGKNGIDKQEEKDEKERGMEEKAERGGKWKNQEEGHR